MRPRSEATPPPNPPPSRRRAFIGLTGRPATTWPGLILPPDLRPTVLPGRFLLQLSGQAEQGRLVAVAAGEHHPDRQALGVHLDGQRHRGLAGEVERRREREGPRL